MKNAAPVEFEVELVQDHKINEFGRYLFKTKCVGFPADWTVTTESLLDTARDVLNDYLVGKDFTIANVQAGEKDSA